MKIRYAVLSAVLAIAQPAFAGTHVWSGASGNKFWSDPANWSSGGAPSINEAAPVIIEIPAAISGATTNNIFGLKIDLLRMLGSGQTIRTASGGTITLRGGNSITNVHSAGVNYIDTTITLEGTNRIVSPVSFNFLGSVIGSGGLETEGTVRFGAAAANTFAGPTILRSGSVTLDNETLVGLVSIPGDLIIQNGLVLFGNSGQLAETSTVTLEAGGVLDLNGYNQTIASLMLAGGTVETDGGTLTLGGNVTASANSSVTGKLSLGGMSRTFQVALNRTLTISAAISGGSGINNAGLTKTGPGTLALAGANSFIGNVFVSEGTLDVRHLSALGASFLGGTSVASNATLSILDGLNIASEALSLTSAKLRCNGTGAWIGPITLNGECALQSVSAGQELALTGAISGPGGFDCIGLGRVLIGGTNSNTFAGVAKVSSGSLRLAKSDGAIAIPGDLIIGGLIGANNSDQVFCAEQNQFSSNSVVTVLPSGQLLLNSGSTTVGGLILQGGEVATSFGTLVLNGNVSVPPAVQQSKIAGKLSLGALQRTFDVAASATYPALEISAVISGTAQGGIRKTGGGTLWLSGNNTYSGATSIIEGEVVVAHQKALGEAVAPYTGNGTLVESGATLSTVLAGGVVQERLWIGGSGVQTNGAINVIGSSVTFAGPITLQTNALFNVPANTTLILSNQISGPGGFTKTGTGTLRFEDYSINNYDGDTIIRGGLVILAKPDGFTSIPGTLQVGTVPAGSMSPTIRWENNDQIRNQSWVWVWGDGALDLNGYREYITHLTAHGPIDLGDGELIVAEGSTVDSVTGTGKIRKLGDGQLLIGQFTQYTGETIVEGGTLNIGNGVASSHVRLEPGTLLMGQKSMHDVTVNGAVLSPGSFTFRAGKMKMDSLLMLNRARFEVQLRGSVPGESYDHLEVDGTVKLIDSYLDVQMGYPGFPNISYMLISNAGNDPVDGTFLGKPEGSTFNIAGAQFYITYQGGDGNDVVLTQLTTSTNDYSPRLYIDPVPGTNEVRVSWPTFATDYQLQRCTNMAAGYWQTAYGQRFVSNDFFHQFFTATNDCLVFRLMRPQN